jgi:hypothetical protein
MSNDCPTFAEIAEENIRQFREKPITYNDVKDEQDWYPEDEIPYQTEDKP